MESSSRAGDSLAKRGPREGRPFFPMKCGYFEPPKYQVVPTV